MIETTNSRFAEVCRQFLAVRRELDQADARLVRALVHPEVKAEDIAVLRDDRQHIERMMSDAITHLRKKYPHRGGSRLGAGWNDPIFDRLDKNVNQTP